MVARLGNFFPQQYRSAYCDGAIRPGAVFRVFVNTTRPPKHKILVVVGLSGDRALVGCLFINSNLNLNINHSNELRNLHMYLESNGREYLEHDSFLDCSQLYEMVFSELHQALESNTEVLRGELSEEDLARAKQIAGAAQTITPKLKKRYGLVVP